MKLKRLFFPLQFTVIAWIMFVMQPNAGAWSSIDQAGSGGSIATHQFLNAEAYDLLKKHPAFSRSGFPALEEIQAHSGVNVLLQGPGPDGIGNSLYSSHYYNPSTPPKGGAPEIVARYHGYLKENLVEKKEVRDRLTKSVSPPARNAAYLAHFIQDMTVSFHVIGLPGTEADPTRPAREQEAGPYGNPTDPAEWKKLVERYRSMKDETMDWFDPTYYDGVSLAADEISPWVIDSTHVLYEGMVEINFKRSYFLNRTRWVMMTPKNPVSPFYERGDLKGMVRRIALATKNRLGTKSSPGPLWFDNRLILQKEGISAALFNSSVIPVPFEQWWTAVQATYSVWRASFSALAVDPADVRLVKAQDKPNLFIIKLKVKNLDPEGDARSVSVAYKGQGGLAAGGTASVGDLPAKAESKEIECGTISLAPERPAEGELLLTVTSDYGAAPDSGEARFVIPMNQVRMENALKMEDFRGSDRDWAKDFLSAEPYNLKVNLDSAGDPPSRDQALRVAEQNPAPGSWIAPGDTATLTAYEEYLVSVPSVVGMNGPAAMGILSDAGLLPLRTERTTEPGTAAEVVLGQSPAAGERVPPRSRVTIIVSIPQKPASPPPGDVKGPPGQPLRLLDEPFPEQPPGEPPVLSELIVTPKSAIINGNQSVRLSVQAFDLDGNPLSPEALASLRFNWIVNDPSVANIAWNRGSAVVSPIQNGKIQAICTAGGAMGIAVITIRGMDAAAGFEDPGDAWERFAQGNDDDSGDGGFSDGDGDWSRIERSRRPGDVPTAPPAPPSRPQPPPQTRAENSSPPSKPPSRPASPPPGQSPGKTPPPLWIPLDDLSGVWISHRAALLRQFPNQARLVHFSREGNEWVGRVIQAGKMAAEMTPVNSVFLRLRPTGKPGEFQGTIFYKERRQMAASGGWLPDKGLQRRTGPFSANVWPSRVAQGCSPGKCPESSTGSASVGSHILRQQIPYIIAPDPRLERVNPCCLPYCQGLIR